MHFNLRFFLGSLIAASVAGPLVGASRAQAHEPAVGLSLFFRDGAMAPLELVGSHRRFLQEVDIMASVTTPNDEGIGPVTQTGDMAQLDWRGLQEVETDWRPAGDGTWTRQRFFRGARWMERPGLMWVAPVDARGRLTGAPLSLLTGSDNRRGPSDDAFVRRFTARQITKGCAAIDDCSTATEYRAEAFASVRGAVDPEREARRIPARTTRLVLIWTADIPRQRSVHVSHVRARDAAFAYGFEPRLEALTAPANGQFYLPGDAITFRLGFFDGEGNSMNVQGSLPTYAEFIQGQVASGLRYFDALIEPTLYYALKHREGNMNVSLLGPTDALKVASQTVGIEQFFLPQATVATVPADGYSAVAAVIPAFPTILGGATDPSLWQLPVSDEVTLTVPADARSGTYVVALKARRDYAGEALNRSATLEIQVGTATPSGPAPNAAGPCNTCHMGRTALSVINHGLGDRRTCYSCHAPLSFEPDNALDYRVHYLHARSDRFGSQIANCAQCHPTPPQGPAAGL